MNYETTFKDIWSLIVARLQELRAKGRTFQELGKMLDVDRATVSRWVAGERGGEKTAAPDLFRYMGALNITIQDAFNTAAVNETEFTFIRKVYARLSAGGGSLETNGLTKGYYAFRKEFVRRTGTTSSNLVLMDVTGDSMEPTLYSGDSVLVSVAEKDLDVRTGDFAAIRVDDEILIKRVSREPGVIKFISDNKRYGDIVIDLGLCNDRFAVIGRAYWMARML